MLKQGTSFTLAAAAGSEAKDEAGLKTEAMLPFWKRCQQRIRDEELLTAHMSQEVINLPDAISPVAREIDFQSAAPGECRAVI